MPVHFTIQITKDILERSKFCPASDDLKLTGENCAVAHALKDLFPDVCVSASHIHPFGKDVNDRACIIELPAVARDFVRVFDSLSSMPRVRPLLPVFDFEICIPDAVISRINIDELRLATSRRDNVYA